MKRLRGLISSVLCAALLLTALPAGAEALPVSKSYLMAEFNEGLYKVNSSHFAYRDGRLLFVSDTQLVSVDPATGEAQTHPLPLPEGRQQPGSMGLTLLENKGGIRLMDIDRGLLYPLTLPGGAPRLAEPLALDWQDYIDLYNDMFGDPEGRRPPLEFLMTEDRLWVMQEDMGYDSGTYFWLTRFDLKTGKEDRPAERFSVGAMTPYQDGKLLITTPMSFTEDGFEMGSFAVMDPDDLSVETLFPIGEMYDLWALGYDKVSNTLFAAFGDRLYRYDNLQGDPVPCADLPSMSHSGVLQVLERDQIVFLGHNGLNMIDTNAERFANKTPLVFLGSFYQSGADETIAELPGYRFSSDFGGLTYAERMLADKSSFDLTLHRTDSDDFQAVMNKGYALDLSAVPGVQAYIDSLYPALREAITMDGKVYGIPIELSAELPGYDRGFFAAIDREPPRDFMDLLSFVDDWQDTYAEDYPNHIPINMWNPREVLIRLALNLYQNQKAMEDAPFSWDDPLLRRMLTALDATQMPKSSSSGWEEESSAEAINLQFSLHDIKYMKGYDFGGPVAHAPLLLSPEEGMAGTLRLNVSILFANAGSARPEAALDFIAHYMNHLPQSVKAMVSPHENAPLENPYYTRTLRNMERELAAQQAAAAQAEGAQQRELEALTSAYSEKVEAYRRDDRWDAGEEEIAAYRHLLARHFVAQRNKLVDLTELQDPVIRYAEQQIDMEQFIKEIEGKTRLMMLENK